MSGAPRRPGPEAGKRLSRARFGRYAASYVTSATHASGGELARLVELARESEAWAGVQRSVMLDIATGGGHTARTFAPHVRHVVASDLAAPMLAEARKHLTESGVANVSYAVADAERLPFAPASFHLTTCRIAAHHFPDPDRFVSEAARVTRPGGLVLVQDQVVPDDQEAAAAVNAFERERDPSHARALTVGEWQDLLAGAGLALRSSALVVKRHALAEWVRVQGGTEATIGRLEDLLAGAPPAAREWLDPLDWGLPEASFVNRHGLFVAERLLAGKEDLG